MQDISSCCGHSETIGALPAEERLQSLMGWTDRLTSLVSMQDCKRDGEEMIALWFEIS